MAKLCVVVLLMVVCFGQAYSSSNLSWLQFLSNDPPVYGCIKDTPGVVCKDCETMQICGKNGEIEASATCKSLNEKTPFCKAAANICVADNTCPISGEANMQCSYPGLFPDPMDCSRFIHCNGKLEAIKYQCPEKSKYDHSKRICAVSSACVTFSPVDGLCKGKAFKTVAHPADGSIFAVCPTATGIIKLRSCNSKYDKVDLNTWGTCGFSCPAEGFYPNSTNKNEFNICVKEGTSLKVYGAKCAENGIFSEKSNFCESVIGETTTPAPTTEKPATEEQKSTTEKSK